MLQMYRSRDGILETVPLTENVEADSIVWVDLISPTPSERAYVIKHFSQPLFTLSELEEIESSARFYEDELGLHILSLFLCESRSDRAFGTTVGFIVQKNRLFSIREREISCFRIYLTRAKRQSITKTNSPFENLLNLLELKTEQLADEIEYIYSELDALNRTILSREEGKFDTALVQLANLEDSSGKIRLCLMDSQRALVSLHQKLRGSYHQFVEKSEGTKGGKAVMVSSQADQAPLQSIELLEVSREMLKNLESLMPHNEALFQRINFLMQTFMGLTELEQNRIMKVFSTVTILTVPTSLISGWLGMNVELFFGPQYLAARFQALAVMVCFSVTIGLYALMKRLRWA